MARIALGPSVGKQSQHRGLTASARPRPPKQTDFLLGEPDLHREASTVLSDQTTGVLPSFVISWCVLGRRRWHPTPALLPEKSHGPRSLEGCSPRGREESDTTERLHFHFSLSCLGEGNGNPLQCSCLENPRDGGAWWAAVYGVTQSRT